MAADITDYDVTNAMISLGGSFASRLGELYQFADTENQARLKATFPELWAKHTDLAQRLKVRAEQFARAGRHGGEQA